VLRRSALVFLPAALAIAGCGGSGKGQKQVTLALDFTPNAAHAGIFQAVAGHSDRAHGIKLVVRQPSASTDSLKLLASGRADISVVDIHDLGLARERGQDLVGVGALVQQPLAAVIARGGIARPRQLAGKRAGVTGLPSDNAVLRSVVDGDGGDYSKVRRITIGFNAVPSLATGKVDAVTAFWNVEGVELRSRGVKTSEFRVNRYGAPTYPELVLVVRRNELDGKRAEISDTLAALEDGTRAVLKDPQAAIGAVAQASGGSHAAVLAQLVAVRPALSPPIRLQPMSLNGWAAFDSRFGILSRPPDVAKAFDTTVAP
jgi:NitT/TauT family transport system substrate-binding protein/putative hydroxymethylpyrimidine transport system substrate-binding protein